MMWRFLVADDRTIDNFLIRDVDSRLSARDVAAVGAWLQTNKAFHCIRDHPSHGQYAVSGGLWGGRPAKLKNIIKVSWASLMVRYHDSYLQDMSFLNDMIWPHMKTGHSYCSDSVSCRKWSGAHPYPVARVGYEHVGQVFMGDNTPRQGDIDILRSAGENLNCVQKKK